MPPIVLNLLTYLSEVLPDPQVLQVNGVTTELLYVLNRATSHFPLDLDGDSALYIARIETFLRSSNLHIIQSNTAFCPRATFQSMTCGSCHVSGLSLSLSSTSEVCSQSYDLPEWKSSEMSSSFISTPSFSELQCSSGMFSEGLLRT